MGDKGLEVEVLQMFARQARRALHDMVGADASGVVAVAHRLKGASRFLRPRRSWKSMGTTRLRSRLSPPLSLKRRTSSISSAAKTIDSWPAAPVEQPLAPRIVDVDRLLSEDSAP
jgi:hypothetical protein